MFSLFELIFKTGFEEIIFWTEFSNFFPILLLKCRVLYRCRSVFFFLSYTSAKDLVSLLPVLSYLCQLFFYELMILQHSSGHLLLFQNAVSLFQIDTLFLQKLHTFWRCGASISRYFFPDVYFLCTSNIFLSLSVCVNRTEYVTIIGVFNILKQSVLNL